MTKFLVPLLMFLFVKNSQGQTIKTFKEYHFTSTYQKERTPDGSLKVSTRTVQVYIKDPEPAATNTDDFDKLPTGKISLKWDNKYEIASEIKYFGKFDFGSAKGQSIYGLTKTDIPYNIFVFVKKKFQLDGKSFNYIILIGEADTENGAPGKLPKTFTILGCN
jgi:hypothetical protein